MDKFAILLPFLLEKGKAKICWCRNGILVRHDDDDNAHHKEFIMNIQIAYLKLMCFFSFEAKNQFQCFTMSPNTTMSSITRLQMVIFINAMNQNKEYFSISLIIIIFQISRYFVFYTVILICGRGALFCWDSLIAVFLFWGHSSTDLSIIQVFGGNGDWEIFISHRISNEVMMTKI